jgi:hypothetical protein
MIKWIKPSGVELETNELKATVAYCESLDWKRAGAKVEDKPKRTRRTKEQMEAARASDNG